MTKPADRHTLSNHFCVHADRSIKIQEHEILLNAIVDVILGRLGNHDKVLYKDSVKRSKRTISCVICLLSAAVSLLCRVVGQLYCNCF